MVRVTYHVTAFSYSIFDSHYWARKVEDVDLTQPGGYAFKGPWLSFRPPGECVEKRMSGVEEGDYFVVFAETRTKWMSYRVHALFHVREGARYKSDSAALGVMLGDAEMEWEPLPESIRDFTREFPRELGVKLFGKCMDNFNWAIALYFHVKILGKRYPEL